MPARSPVTRKRPIQDSLRFLGAFVRHPMHVGALLPSSRFLARALLGGAKYKPGDFVLEYGPGTGSVTQFLRPAVRSGVRYLGIERDPKLHSLLEQRYPDMQFHLGSCEDVVKILKERKLPRPVFIVSGIPWASLPPKMQERIIQGTKEILTPGGEFRTFQYVLSYSMVKAKKFRAKMETLFEDFRRIGPIFRNVPPAYVLAYKQNGVARPHD